MCAACVPHCGPEVNYSPQTRADYCARCEQRSCAQSWRDVPGEEARVVAEALGSQPRPGTDVEPVIKISGSFRQQKSRRSTAICLTGSCRPTRATTAAQWCSESSITKCAVIFRRSSRRAAQLAGQRRKTAGGVCQSAAGTRQLRQELTAAARRDGGTQLRALLRDGRHAALPSAGTGEHSEAAVGACRRVQPEPGSAQDARRGHSAGAEKPLRHAYRAHLLAALARKWSKPLLIEAVSPRRLRNTSYHRAPGSAGRLAENQLVAPRAVRAVVSP